MKKRNFQKGACPYKFVEKKDTKKQMSFYKSVSTKNKIKRKNIFHTRDIYQEIETRSQKTYCQKLKKVTIFTKVYDQKKIKKNNHKKKKKKKNYN